MSDGSDDLWVFIGKGLIVCCVGSDPTEFIPWTKLIFQYNSETSMHYHDKIKI
jgi:hypothetical protein